MTQTYKQVPRTHTPSSVLNNAINTALKPAVSNTWTTGYEERLRLAAGDTRRAALMQDCLTPVCSAVWPGSTCAYRFGNSPSFQPCPARPGPPDVAGTRLPPEDGARSPRRRRLRARQGPAAAARPRGSGQVPPVPPAPHGPHRFPPPRPASPCCQLRAEVPAPGPAQPALHGAANGARGRGGAAPTALAASALRGETRRERGGELDGARAPHGSAAQRRREGGREGRVERRPPRSGLSRTAPADTWEPALPAAALRPPRRRRGTDGCRAPLRRALRSGRSRCPGPLRLGVGRSGGSARLSWRSSTAPLLDFFFFFFFN